MRAILIDPVARVVREVDIERGNDDAYEAMRSVVFAERPPDETRWLEAVQLGRAHTMFVDEEGILKRWETQHFFQFSTGQFFAGRGIVIGVGKWGDSIEATLPLTLLSPHVTFVERETVRIPTPTLTAFGQDGRVDVTPLADVDFWTLAHQPR